MLPRRGTRSWIFQQVKQERREVAEFNSAIVASFAIAEVAAETFARENRPIILALDYAQGRVIL